MEKDALLYTDDLTGLGNRRLLRKFSETLFEEFVSDYSVFSVAITDLDHFKEVNDTYGHLKGDKVIKEFSNFLKSSLRKNDIIIRYGGDEFIVIQPGLKKEDAILVWQRLVERLKGYLLDDLSLSMSVGVATYPDDSTSFEELLKKADAGLYEAKRSGRGRVGLKQGKSLTIPPKIFVDRTEEKGILIENIKRGVVTLLKGEAGIGKTRLIREALSSIKGLEILWTDCISFSRGVSYYPLRELLKYRIERLGKGFLEKLPLPYKVELGKLVPLILKDIRDSEIKEIGETLDRYRLYEGFLLAFSSGDKQKIIVIDNIQWIDEDSVEVLKYIARRAKNKINFILASRTEETNEYAHSLLSEISRVMGIKEVNLLPFSKSDVSLLVEAILGEKDEKLTDFVFQKSGGNAFYIEEIIKSLYENGNLYLHGDKWILREVTSDTFSKSIEDIVEEKLRRLSPEGLEALKISSVIGYIDIDFIKELTGYNEGHILGLIESALEKGLLRETDSGEVRFKGEVIREVIYGRKIGNLKKRHLHKVAGEFLKKYHPDKIEEIAYHWKMAGLKESVIEYAFKAGEKSEKIYANDMAIKYYGWVIDAIETSKNGKSKYSDRLVEAYLRKARVLNLIGRKNEAVSFAEKALKVATEQNLKEDIVRSLNVLSTLHWGMSDNEKGIEEAKRALELAGELNDKRLIAESSKNIGDVYENIGEYRKALQYYNDSLYIFKELKDKNNQSAVLNNIGIVYEHLGDYKTALSIYEEALRLSKEEKDLVGEGVTLVNIGTVYKHMGDYATALSYYMKALEISLKIGLKVAEGRCYNNIGVIYGQTGEYEKALEYFKKELEISQNVGDRLGEDIALSNIGMLYEMIGDYNEAMKCYKEALKVSEEVQDKIGMEISLRNMGAINFRWGKIEEARSLIKQAQQISLEIGDKSNEATTINDLGIIEFVRGNYFEAIKLLKKALSIREEIGEKPGEIESLLMLFEVYFEMENFNESRIYIEKVLIESDELEESPLLANVLIHNLMWLIHNKKFQESESVIKKIEKIENILSKELWGDYYFTLGLFFTACKNAQKAIQNFRKAIDVFKTLDYAYKIGKTFYYMSLVNTAERKPLLKKAINLFNEIGAIKWTKKCEKLLKS